jgi:NAD(P)H dehydrogenase (quinone)
MKVAITAANGRLGTQVVKAVLALIPGVNVVGLARTPDKAQHLGIEVRPGDYNAKDDLE